MKIYRMIFDRYQCDAYISKHIIQRKPRRLLTSLDGDERNTSNAKMIVLLCSKVLLNHSTTIPSHMQIIIHGFDYNIHEYIHTANKARTVETYKYEGNRR